MSTIQGSLELLNDAIALELLRSNIPARLASVWRTGRPALFQSRLVRKPSVYNPSVNCENSHIRNRV